MSPVCFVTEVLSTLSHHGGVRRRPAWQVFMSKRELHTYLEKRLPFVIDPLSMFCPSRSAFSLYAAAIRSNTVLVRDHNSVLDLASLRYSH
jgi:hypothetical protein